MFAQIKHMAIVSSNVNHEGDFYRDIFGMKRSGVARTGGAVVVRDGYVGLNLNPERRDARPVLITSDLKCKRSNWFSRGSRRNIPRSKCSNVRATDLSPALAPTIPRAMSSISPNKEWKTAPTCMLKKTSKEFAASAILDCASCNLTKSENFTAPSSTLSNWKNLGVIPITISPTEKSRSRSCLGKSQIF